MKLKVDINCDMGESFGLYTLGNDEAMMKYITSANIACGFHAGDPHVMRKTVETAKKYNISIGAHPGFPDIIGFGRRKMLIAPSEAKDYIVYQVGALREFASITGQKIHHCKPHGQLYMMAMTDEVLAKAILEAVAEIDSDMIVFALENSAISYLGQKMGIQVAKEAYADCEHTKEGSIVPIRTHAAAGDNELRAKRIVRMIKENKVITDTGEDMDIHVDTICVHGDTAGAPELVKCIYDELTKNNIEVESLKD